MTETKNPAARPHRLGPNKVPVYYEGGAAIDRFRGVSGDLGPEDWVGSVTVFPPELRPLGADPTTGVSRLEDGSSLRELVLTDPVGWLGPELAGAFNGEPGLLVKLLDAGERLPVHCHPDRAVAREKLGSPFGKTEGWVIMAAAPGAEIWLGFSRDVDATELRAWIDRQDVDAMLASMNRIEVYAGDVFYLPAGIPHSIGPSILLTELQEPTSFSILAEYETFGLNETQATLGLGWEEALTCFDLLAYDGVRLERLRTRPELAPVAGDGELWRLFPAEAAPFFQAYRARLDGEAELGESRFRILVVERGEGALLYGSAEMPVRAGETWVVPYGAGPLRARGNLELVACDPPEVERTAVAGR
jgi:mannose-6-phosphate isomerase